MASIHHQIWIDAPIATVYRALASAEGLSRWWIPHQDVERDGERLLCHHAGSSHGAVLLRVLEASAERCLRWEVISRHPPQSPAAGWMGTEIRFDLARRASPGPWLGLDNPGEPMTVLDLRHLGWREDSGFLGHCSLAWAQTLLRLRDWANAQVHGAAH